jgi:hypothetical protein
MEQLNLFSELDRDKITLDLFQAYFDARKNKRNTINALAFEKHLEANLFALANEIIERKYTPKPSICFIVDKPVKREIFAADFRNRVIHHFIFNYISPIFEKTFINDSYSCRKGKGIQIGYEDYRYLSFGEETNSPNNGKYAIEYWDWPEEKAFGLNFWKPWPTGNAGNYILFLRDDHNIGMGTVGDPKFRLDIAGRARAFHFFNSSDERYKKDINTISNPLETIMKLRGVTYKLDVNIDKYSADKNNFTETKNNTIQNDESINIQSNDIGFIAQEVQKVLPQIVIEDEKGYLSMNYDVIIPLLVEALKEQQKTILNLEDKVSSIESN